MPDRISLVELQEKFQKIANLDYELSGHYPNQPYKIVVQNDMFIGRIRHKDVTIHDKVETHVHIEIERPAKFITSIDLPLRQY